MSKPQKFLPYTHPKNSPLGPQKVKNDTNMEIKSRVEGNIENKSCSTT